MDESEGGSAGVRSAEADSDPDEQAVRRAIHDLGSHDFEERAVARTYILSAGQAALPLLLREIKADRKRSRNVAQRVALLVAGVVLAGPALEYFLNWGWLVPLSSISACLILLLSCLLFTRPAWHAEASKLLHKFGGHEVTRAMIHALTDVWGEEQPRLRQTIIQRLERVTPEDASWLEGETRERVVAMLSVPNWSSATCVNDLLTIARALAEVGATEAIPVLKGVSCSSLQGERRERLEAEIGAILRQLEKRAEHDSKSEALLRVPHAGAHALVRPASSRAEDENLLQQPADDVHVGRAE